MLPRETQQQQQQTPGVSSNDGDGDNGINLSSGRQPLRLPGMLLTHAPLMEGAEFFNPFSPTIIPEASSSDPSLEAIVSSSINMAGPMIFATTTSTSPVPDSSSSSFSQQQQQVIPMASMLPPTSRAKKSKKGLQKISDKKNTSSEAKELRQEPASFMLPMQGNMDFNQLGTTASMDQAVPSSDEGRTKREEREIGFTTATATAAAAPPPPLSSTPSLRRACDSCCLLKIKCTAQESIPCVSCINNARICTFSPQRKRGPRPWSNSERAKRRRRNTEIKAEKRKAAEEEAARLKAELRSKSVPPIMQGPFKDKSEGGAS